MSSMIEVDHQIIHPKNKKVNLQILITELVILFSSFKLSAENNIFFFKWKKEVKLKMDILLLCWSMIHPRQDWSSRKMQAQGSRTYSTLVSFSYFLFLNVPKKKKIIIILFYFFIKNRTSKTETGSNYTNRIQKCDKYLILSHPFARAALCKTPIASKTLSFSLSVWLPSFWEGVWTPKEEEEVKEQKNKNGAASSRGRSAAKATTAAASWRPWADRNWNH